MSPVSRALLLALLALTVASAPASAQFISRPDSISVMPVPGYEGGPIHADIRVETPQKDIMPVFQPWFAIGHDTVLNLTVRNNQETPLNATFRLNVTGATASPTEFTFELGAYEHEGVTFTVHPEDVGMVEIVADAIDAFQPSGEPVRAILAAPALLLPSIRFLDPPPVAPPSEDDEFQQIDSYRGMRQGLTAYVRIRPGEAIMPRFELTNPFQTSIAGFVLRMQVPGQGQEMTVDVQPMDAGATQVVEFPEFTPVERSHGGPFYGGPMGSFELRPTAVVSVGGAQLSAGATSFRVERGAIVDVLPVVGAVDVQDGLAIDMAVPRKPVLGVPTRIMYNLTNLGTSIAEGRLTLQITTPGNMFYEVQGPETHQIPVSLAPGERSSGSVDFTPRVTGAWGVSSVFRSAQGFGYGGGGGFEVKGPLAIGFDRSDQIFARIGEPVEIGISLVTSAPIQDAQLRIGSASQYYRDPSGMSGSDYRPGFAESLIQSRSPTSSLGTLREGGAVNASVEVIGRSSGYYNIVPYVVAEGFAYTSTPQFDPSRPIVMEPGYYSTMLNVIVQARPVPAALSLAPLTLGLAFFVGAWTMRTRFVK